MRSARVSWPRLLCLETLSPAYRRAVLDEIEPELAAARQLQALFQQTPWPYTQLLRRSARFWSAFCRIVRGEARYTQFQERLGPARSLVNAAAAALAARRESSRTGW